MSPLLIAALSPFWSSSFGSTSPMAESQMPKNTSAMNILEDALEPALYQDEFATLALVSTGENSRE